MLHNKYICDNPIQVTREGDLYTFTYLDCRQTSRQVIRSIINEYAYSYFCNEGLLSRVPGIYCGQIPFTFSGNSANILLIPGLGGSATPPPLLLDQYQGAVGYSLRKLRNAYSGSAIEVRRASDDTTLDVGFIGEDLNTAAIEAFCSGTTGHVSKWYDQVGSNDAVQAILTRQPVIYESGAVVVSEFGRPSVRCYDDDVAAIESRLDGGFWAALDAPWVAVSAVYSLNAITAGSGMAVHYGNMMRMIHFNGRPRAQNVRDGGGVFATALVGDIPPLNTTTVRLDSSDKSFLSIWLNLSATPAAQVVDGTGDITNAPTIFVGDTTDNAGTHDFLISEIVGFDTDQSANNLAIRTNQSVYWKPVVLMSSFYLTPDGSDIFQPDGTNQYIAP